MDPESDSMHRPTSGFVEEGEFADPDHDLTATETDQALSAVISWNCMWDQIFHGLHLFIGHGQLFIISR